MRWGIMESYISLLVLMMGLQTDARSLARMARQADKDWCNMPRFREADYHGFPIPQRLQSNVKIPFKCKEDFYNTPTYTTCLGGDYWTALDPPCIPVRCEDVVEPVRGRVKVEGVGRGDQVFFSCDFGYQYSGSINRTCTRSGQWSGVPGQCDEIQCFPPYLEHGSFTGGSVFQFMNVVEALCMRGFAYNGSESHVCRENNQWSGTIGKCVNTSLVECPSLAADRHLVDAPTRGSYRQKVKLTCETGYNYSGAPTRECRLNGTWSGPQGHCKPVQCNKTILQLPNADVTVTGYSYTSRASVHCHSGFYLTGNDVIHCQEDGLWEEAAKCEVYNQWPVVVGVVVGVLVVFIAFGLLVKYIHYKRHSEDALTKELKATIRDMGHSIWRPDDKKIDFKTQFIQPRIVVGNLGEKDEEEVVHGKQYKKYLRKYERPGTTLKDVIDDENTGGSTVLIYGRGSVGKSTLAEYIVHQWAEGELGEDYAAFLLMSMRNTKLMGDEEMTLTEFLQKLMIHPLKKRPITEGWLKKNAVKVTILMDALDQHQDCHSSFQKVTTLTEGERARPFDWCVDILRRKILPESRLIITTRSFEWLNELPIEKQYEVIGLTREGVIQMIEKHVKEEKRKEVKEIILNNPVLLSLSYITFFSMMLCKALERKDSGREEPEDLCTASRITAFIIKVAAQCVGPLATLAYQGVVKMGSADLSHLLFHHQDLRSAGCTQHIVKEACDVGLVFSRPTDETTIEFLHLSIQRLLAMLALLKEKRDARREILPKLWESKGAIQNLLGLMYDTEYGPIKDLRELVEIRNNQSYDDILPLMLEYLAKSPDQTLRAVRMSYECQSEEIMQRITGHCFATTGTLSFTQGELTDIDMKAIVYNFKHSTYIHTLRLGPVYMDRTMQKMLGSFLGEDSGLKNLDLRDVRLTQEGLTSLSNSLRTNHTLQNLSLDSEDLDDDKMKILADGIRENRGLERLSFVNNPFGRPGMEALTSSLVLNTDIKTVRLGEKLDDASIKELANEVNHKRFRPINWEEN